MGKNEQTSKKVGAVRWATVLIDGEVRKERREKGLAVFLAWYL